MIKKPIRLTENDLHKNVKESVNKILNETKKKTVILHCETNETSIYRLFWGCLRLFAGNTPLFCPTAPTRRRTDAGGSRTRPHRHTIITYTNINFTGRSHRNSTRVSLNMKAYKCSSILCNNDFC